MLVSSIHQHELYTYVHSLLNIPSISHPFLTLYVVTEYWVGLPASYSKFLPFTYFIHGNVCFHSKYQLWVSFGRNDAKAEIPVLWPPHVKSWLIGKDSDAVRDWGQEEKGTTEDEMSGWHHRLNGCESEWTSGDGDGQGGLACCDSWVRKESDTTEWLNWTECMFQFTYVSVDSMLLSQFVPPSSSPIVSISLFSMPVFLLLPCK